MTTTAPTTSQPRRSFWRWVAAHWLQIPTAVVALGITTLGFLASFVALRELAAAAGLAADIAWVWPVIVDGIIVMAIMALFAWRDRDWRSKWDAGAGLVGFTLVSIASNAYHTGLVHDETAQASLGMSVLIAVLIGAVPPASMAVAIHFFVKMVTPYKASSASAEVAPETTETSSAPAPAASAPSAPAAVAEADGVPVIELTASPVTDSGDSATTINDESLTVAAPSVPTALTVRPTADDELDGDVNVTADSLTFTDLVSDSASTVSVITDIQTDDKLTVTPELPVSDPIPATPAEQVAWLVERAEAGHDTSVATIRRLFEDAGRPSSESSVSRRLRDAKKQAPAAFAA